MKTKTEKNRLVPYPVIVSASGGDADAINDVLAHFGGYITALSTRRLFDNAGNYYLYIDEALRRRLETKLIAAIITFNAA